MLNLHDAEKLNFRSFSLDGYSASSVIATAKSEGLTPVIYPMTSVMNKYFIYEASVKDMMKETAETFENNIFYLDSTNLQKITEEIMYGSSVSSAAYVAGSHVEKAGKRWRERFKSSEKSLRDERVSLAHKVLSWNDFLEHPAFSTIYNFVIALVGRQKKLKECFPGEEVSEVLTRLEQDAKATLLSDKLTQTTDLFIQHNPRALKELSSKPGQPFSGDISLLRKVKVDTRLYLAQEFSVFLLLAYLHSVKEPDDKLGVTSLNSASSGVMPLLSYPISASEDGHAETTFQAFLTIQQLYQNYSEALHLPFISRPLTIVDSLISPSCRPPTNPNPRAKKTKVILPSAASSTAGSDGESDESFHSEKAKHKKDSIRSKAASLTLEEGFPKISRSASETQVCSSWPPSIHISSMFLATTNNHDSTQRRSPGAVAAELSPAVVVPQASVSQPDERFSSGLTASSSFFSAAPAVHVLTDEKIKGIIDKIIAAIDSHVLCGTYARTLKYKNGVTCEISVKGHRSSALNAVVTSLETMRKTIGSAVQTALDGDEDICCFSYRELMFELKAKPTEPELTLQHQEVVASASFGGIS